MIAFSQSQIWEEVLKSNYDFLLAFEQSILTNVLVTSTYNQMFLISTIKTSLGEVNLIKKQELIYV